MAEPTLFYVVGPKRNRLHIHTDVLDWPEPPAWVTLCVQAYDIWPAKDEEICSLPICKVCQRELDKLEDPTSRKARHSAKKRAGVC
jgi:hypothetical protein